MRDTEVEMKQSQPRETIRYAFSSTATILVSLIFVILVTFTFILPGCSSSDQTSRVSLTDIDRRLAAIEKTSAGDFSQPIFEITDLRADVAELKSRVVDMQRKIDTLLAVIAQMEANK